MTAHRTWYEKCESFENLIINGNRGDVKKLLKSYTRQQRYECIAHIKNSDVVSESKLWDYINICITGNFK